MCSCNSHEYKGIVTNKDVIVKTDTFLYNPTKQYFSPLNWNIPLKIRDTNYILIVKDSLNNENKYVVGENTYNEINIGDKYFE